MSLEEQLKKQEKLKHLLAKAASSRAIGEEAEAQAAEKLAKSIIASLYSVPIGEELITTAKCEINIYNRTLGQANERSIGNCLARWFGVYFYLNDSDKKYAVFYGQAANVNNVVLLFNFIRSNYSSIAIDEYKKHVAKAKAETPGYNPIQLYKLGKILTDGKFYRSFTSGAITALWSLMLGETKDKPELLEQQTRFKDLMGIKSIARKINTSVDTNTYKQGLKHGDSTNLRPGVEKTELKALN